jgi:cell wall assembly regulator SMI1
MTSPFPSYTPHVPAKPKTLSRQNWKEIAKDRKTWRDLAEKAKTHKGLVSNDDDDVAANNTEHTEVFWQSAFVTKFGIHKQFFLKTRNTNFTKLGLVGVA